MNLKLIPETMIGSMLEISTGPKSIFLESLKLVF